MVEHVTVFLNEILGWDHQNHSPANWGALRGVILTALNQEMFVARVGGIFATLWKVELQKGDALWSGNKTAHNRHFHRTVTQPRPPPQLPTP